MCWFKVLEQNSDLKEKRPFEAVITVLKACKDEASQSIFRFGLTFLNQAFSNRLLSQDCGDMSLAWTV